MLFQMTERQIKELGVEMDEWWASLDPVTKSQIHNFVSGMNERDDVKKAKKEHLKRMVEKHRL